MRYAATLSLLTIAIFSGCRSQSTPLTNPFLVPDRVPPPSTQVLAPGAAAPYYQGDAMPTAAPLAAPLPNPMQGMPSIPAVAAPPGSFAPAPIAAPPASAYPGPASPPAGYQAAPITPTSPPLNYTPQAKGESIGVPNDEQSLRFAAASLTPVASSASSPAAGETAANSAEFRAPIQSTPLAGSAAASGAQRAFIPNAGMQAPGSQTLPGREVALTEYQAPAAPASADAAMLSADGFRPQGSQPRAASASESPSANGFRPPAIGKQTAGGDSPTGRYGVGPDQKWLRGQLEYWPETGEWSINYMDEGPKDQIGGRVLIDNPQVLGHLPAGEFVMLEGQLYGRQIDESYYRPAYRIAVVQRQRQ